MTVTPTEGRMRIDPALIPKQVNGYPCGYWGSWWALSVSHRLFEAGLINHVYTLYSTLMGPPLNRDLSWAVDMARNYSPPWPRRDMEVMRDAA